MPRVTIREAAPLKNAACYRPNGKPLSAYPSEGEASYAADTSRARGLNLIPYECEKCGYWHLSPKSRQTPSTHCNLCNKQLYETKAVAEKRAKIREKENGVKLQTYKCPCYNGYHLTQRKHPQGR
jgi:hypothetical protein